MAKEKSNKKGGTQFHAEVLEGYGKIPRWCYNYHMEMLADNRGEEWRQTWDKYMNGNFDSKSPWRIAPAVCKHMGHENCNKLVSNGTVGMRREAKIREGERGFDATVGTLPRKVEYGEELDWVATHPKISASRRSLNKNIILTDADITDSPNGACPSQRAARLLQQFVDSPGLFWKLVQEYQRRLGKGEGKDDSGGKAKEIPAQDLSLDEVERILREVSS